jgi:hypothetical protein
VKARSPKKAAVKKTSEKKKRASPAKPKKSPSKAKKAVKVPTRKPKAPRPKTAVKAKAKADPTTNTAARLSPRYEGKTRGCHCSH